jgi:hypothetical protein
MATIQELLGREPTEKEWYDLCSPLQMLPSICEYERRWETKALAHNTTDATRFTLYVSYSCACFYCAHPEKECHAKRGE